VDFLVLIIRILVFLVFRVILRLPKIEIFFKFNSLIRSVIFRSSSRTPQSPRIFLYINERAKRTSITASIHSAADSFSFPQS